MTNNTQLGKELEAKKTEITNLSSILSTLSDEKRSREKTIAFTWLTNELCRRSGSRLATRFNALISKTEAPSRTETLKSLSVNQIDQFVVGYFGDPLLAVIAALGQIQGTDTRPKYVNQQYLRDLLEAASVYLQDNRTTHRIDEANKVEARVLLRQYIRDRDAPLPEPQSTDAISAVNERSTNTVKRVLLEFSVINDLDRIGNAALNSPDIIAGLAEYLIAHDSEIQPLGH
jgi:hypothetical protein